MPDLGKPHQADHCGPTTTPSRTGNRRIGAKYHWAPSAPRPDQAERRQTTTAAAAPSKQTIPPRRPQESNGFLRAFHASILRESRLRGSTVLHKASIPQVVESGA